MTQKFSSLILASSVLLTCAVLIACNDPEWKTTFVCCNEEYSIEKVVCFSQDTLHAVADGNQLVGVSACIPIQSGSDISSIVFTIPAEAGTIENMGQTVTKTLDEDKSAHANIKVSRSPGIYNIESKVTYNSKDYADNAVLVLDRVTNDQVSLIIENMDNIQADNTTLTQGRVSVSTIRDIEEEVVIKVNGPMKVLGGSDDSELRIRPDGTGAADFLLRSGTDQGQVVVSASYDSYQGAEVIIQQALAKPDEMVIISDESVIKVANDSVRIDVFLRREKGEVSNGVFIQAQAIQKVGNEAVPVGYFKPPNVEGANSPINEPNASIYFKVSQTDTLSTEAPVIITLTVDDSDGQIVTDSTYIQVRE